MRPVTSSNVIGIGGPQKAIIVVTIDILFASFKFMIPVWFIILSHNTPSLFFMKYLLYNAVILSLYNATISFVTLTQKFQMYNYLMIHQWVPDDFSFALSGSETSKHT